jgi:phenylpropionate dioxygenase-like ring-hydroxylating dioxygenase large terminal subunit
MLAHEDNIRLTRVGPGTPMGELMRRYWAPAGFAHQIAKPDGPPVRVKLLGERLVMFRDTKGRVGLLDERCPHRTASLFLGRNEDCGLRCVYHGWKFDVEGNCIDLPSEPRDYNLQARIKAKAYPCVERGGLIWAYMGPAEHKPEFPELEWALIPDSHRYATRHVQECNWLQGLEGGFDTSHLSFLHGGSAHAEMRVVPTRYEVVPTDFGFVAGSGRDMSGEESGEDGMLWSANVMLMPFHKIIASTPMAAHVWAPMDDHTTMLYSVDYNAERPLTKEDRARSEAHLGIHTENIPGTDRAIQNKDNDYLIDRELQAHGGSFTGMKGLGIQDCAVQESMGPIADRTIEHLGISDSAIVKIRRLLLQALKDHAAGKPLPGADPKTWRVRSARYKAPVGASFADTMEQHVRVGTLAAAE